MNIIVAIFWSQYVIDSTFQRMGNFDLARSWSCSVFKTHFFQVTHRWNNLHLRVTSCTAKMLITYPESRPQTRTIRSTKRHVDKSTYHIAKSENSDHNGYNPGCFGLSWFSVTRHLSENLKNAARNLSTLDSLGFTTAPVVCLQKLYCSGGSNLKRPLIKVIPRESCPVQCHRNEDKHTSPNRMNHPMVRKLQNGANMHLNTHWKLNSAKKKSVHCLPKWLPLDWSAFVLPAPSELRGDRERKQ